MTVPNPDFTYRSFHDAEGNKRYAGLYRMVDGPWRRCQDAEGADLEFETIQEAELSAARSLVALLRKAGA